jgi:hypothetical protein
MEEESGRYVFVGPTLVEYLKDTFTAVHLRGL